MYVWNLFWDTHTIDINYIFLLQNIIDIPKWLKKR